MFSFRSDLHRNGRTNSRARRRSRTRTLAKRPSCKTRRDYLLSRCMRSCTRSCMGSYRTVILENFTKDAAVATQTKNYKTHQNTRRRAGGKLRHFTPPKKRCRVRMRSTRARMRELRGFAVSTLRAYQKHNRRQHRGRARRLEAARSKSEATICGPAWFKKAVVQDRTGRSAVPMHVWVRDHVWVLHAIMYGYVPDGHPRDLYSGRRCCNPDQKLTEHPAPR